jgi:flagellar hook-basal body complex protein FliE
MTAPVAAAAAYRRAEALAQAGTTPAAGSDFGAVLARAMEQAVEIGQEADAATTRALTGQGSVTDVVLAVGRAELALQTVVALRDRVIAAYQDVMRMPI